ncbi:alpha/beta hydrolase [Sinomonas terrae]|uniref:Alpha/beta hydrolase n=1 Tax=Sinomonas terrae TaxID=2908838 RepID=A0ABS9U102_9MICC|nr:alpha/beta hydrolase [Sinomonas terrae]MCH6470359.1 alpha/beta hydrolase [Sinomonas terrae]
MQRDLRYGPESDMLLDLIRPEEIQDPTPLVLWIHGGAFVGGSKEELTGYFQTIAAEGYTVAAPRYSLAPKHHYPTPLRQIGQALAFLQGNASRLNLDPERVVIAGDSAGAHIAAQIAALVSTPGYAQRVGVPVPLDRGRLLGLILACGPYDLSLADDTSTPAVAVLIKASLWAYSGRRRFMDDASLAPWSITDFVTPEFPPTLITVGNSDPLRAHSERLAAALTEVGLKPETVFWPDADPPLGHEYQFLLDTEAAQVFLARMLAFLAEQTHNADAQLLSRMGDSEEQEKT